MNGACWRRTGHPERHPEGHQGENEEAVVKVTKELMTSNGRMVQSAEWSLTNGILYFCKKNYVPDHSDLQRQIVAPCHDTRIAGHAGRWKTLELVSLVAANVLVHQQEIAFLRGWWMLVDTQFCTLSSTTLHSILFCHLQVR
jgi:hypothetical protein